MFLLLSESDFFCRCREPLCISSTQSCFHCPLNRLFFRFSHMGIFWSWTIDFLNFTTIFYVFLAMSDFCNLCFCSREDSVPVHLAPPCIIFLLQILKHALWSEWTTGLQCGQGKWCCLGKECCVVVMTQRKACVPDTASSKHLLCHLGLSIFVWMESTWSEVISMVNLVIVLVMSSQHVKQVLRQLMNLAEENCSSPPCSLILFNSTPCWLLFLTCSRSFWRHTWCLHGQKWQV